MKAKRLKPKCPHCGSRRTIKIGYFLASRPRMHKVQRIQCKTCGRTFSSQTHKSATRRSQRLRRQ